MVAQNQAMRFVGTPISGVSAAEANSWSVAQRGSIVEVGFGAGIDFPQYAALHTDTGFLRLAYGRDSDWGTSIVLLPSFWEAGRYYQGAQISAGWHADVTDLVISFTGAISSLRVLGEVRLSPPVTRSISCIVKLTVDGGLVPDSRPGEAFKLVALSSMHISADQWDGKSVEVESEAFQIPVSGWIVRPPAIGNRFALSGGRSTWKRHAPSLNIELDRNLEITGWKTDSSNPNDDNLAVWAATDQVVPHWQYTVVASAE